MKPLPYRVFLHIDITHVVPKSGIRRTRILEFCESLSNSTNWYGDFQSKDIFSGQTLEGKGSHGYLVYWHVDHSDKQVNIYSIIK